MRHHRRSKVVYSGGRIVHIRNGSGFSYTKYDIPVQGMGTTTVVTTTPPKVAKRSDQIAILKSLQESFARMGK